MTTEAIFPTTAPTIVDLRPILSEQAKGGRLTAPADAMFPYRCVILEQRTDGYWRIASIFEMRTDTEAEEAGLEICTEPYPDGVTMMHYYVGEVA